MDGVKDTKENVSSSNLDRGEMWHRMIALTKRRYNQMHPGGHKIITIEPKDIIDVTKNTIKLDYEAIISNWTQRQLPRFRDAPIGPTTEKAINELLNFQKTFKEERSNKQFVSLQKDYRMIQDLELISLHRTNVDSSLAYTKMANFEQEFAPVFDLKHLEAKQAELRFKISHQSLTLYPEYQYKLEILKRLNYIDDQHSVTLKGRVACEMGSNELMITELVLCNTFNDLDPAEISAILSSLVFQGKTQTELLLTDNLQKVMLLCRRRRRPFKL